MTEHRKRREAGLYEPGAVTEEAPAAEQPAEPEPEPEPDFQEERPLPQDEG